ncbi:MAG: hypothetical protein K9L86_06365 [Candidatus Omnitrophica bacterium]|nr:hypothetical protein [Candidatus Omnitrophota bacterium]
MKIYGHWVKIVAFLIFVFGLSIGVFAESKITAKGQGVHHKAELKVFLNENIYYGGKNRIEFKAKGLEPRGLYTVWLLKGSAMAGVGKSPYSFFADNLGQGTYVGGVEAHKLGSWHTIKIVIHEDSDAENMDEDNLTTVFLVDIEEFLSGKKGTSEDQELIKPKISIYKGPLKIRISN